MYERTKQVYGAVSDVAQVLMHRSTYTDTQLTTRVRALGKCHARNLFYYSSHSLFYSMPPELQEEVANLPDFCDKDGNLVVK